ncbi:uncharacterized protein LOC130675181 [Microplitis mediator]|uniref:uncharacterized protein LOC130675181 n=1 Tax=Microplitis mediator TaxID=375433 RepID=UPI0025551076|nr:uncharacterized protein LOC130675181 [Microplitis mediator]
MNVLNMEKKLLTFVLFTLVEYIDCCAIETDRPMSEVVEQNLNSPWLVLIMDNRGRAFPPGIAYGSIISENLVLTAAKAVSNHNIGHLVLMTDCDINSESEGTDIQSCIYRRVFLIYYENKAFSTTVKENYWAVLDVDKPFELTKRVNTIPLINDNNIDDIDKNNCSVYHWAVAVNYDDAAFITMEYSVVSDEEGFKINKDDEQRFKDDADCILDPCTLENEQQEKIPRNMSFVGSPIACPLKSDPTTYVQAGFATIVYKVYTRTPLKYEHLTGTLYDLSPRQESLNKLVTRLTNIIEEGKKT